MGALGVAVLVTAVGLASCREGERQINRSPDPPSTGPGGALDRYVSGGSGEHIQAEEGFDARFPTAPARKEHVTRGDRRPLRVITYTSRTEGVSFDVAAAEYPELPPNRYEQCAPCPMV